MLVILTSEALGHGRNSTAIGADVAESGAVVRIDAVVIDLLLVGGVSLREWRELNAEERGQLLDKSARLMAGRFRLNAEERVLDPLSVEVDIPDLASPVMRRIGLDQQSVPIVLRYNFDSPPSMLTFWQNFDAGNSTEPIYAQLLIRRSGNMVMLPAELGKGFPVSFPFDWAREPQPLAHRRSLQSAACNWQNRPANGRLEVSEKEVRWTVYVSLEAMLAGSDIKIGDDWVQLREQLESMLYLKINGTKIRSGITALRVYPLSAHALMHDRRLDPGESIEGMVEIEVLAEAGAFPDQVEVGWLLYNESIPLLYSEIWENGDVVEFDILNAERTAHHWSRTP